MSASAYTPDSHARRCMRRFWGFCRRFVKSQKEPEKNLANVVRWDACAHACLLHLMTEYRAVPYEIVRNRTVSYGIVR